jgi:hypothetical protein
MTIDSMIDFINSDLTMSGSIPTLLPPLEIRRLVTEEALPYFYQNYQFSLQKAYLLVLRKSLLKDPDTGWTSAILPDEVFSIVRVIPISDPTLFNMGINAPNMNLNLGVTNQPYLTSFVTTVGELGVYKCALDGFADVLNMLSKNTIKTDYNFNNNRFHILTSTRENLILEARLKIECERLFEDELFKRYVKGLALRQLGRMLTRYNFQLPGGYQINGEALKTDGQAEMDKVMETIKGQSNVTFFFMK